MSKILGDLSLKIISNDLSLDNSIKSIVLKAKN